jgi:hypothetical protein
MDMRLIWLNYVFTWHCARKELLHAISRIIRLSCIIICMHEMVDSYEGIWCEFLCAALSRTYFILGDSNFTCVFFVGLYYFLIGYTFC